MENLRRSTLVRPAVAQDPDTPSIGLPQQYNCQNAARGSLPDGRDGAEAASRAYVESAEFLRNRPPANSLPSSLASPIRSTSWRLTTNRSVADAMTMSRRIRLRPQLRLRSAYQRPTSLPTKPPSASSGSFATASLPSRCRCGARGAWRGRPLNAPPCSRS